MNSKIKGNKRGAAADPDQNIKRAIWAYLILLIFEGALRKWFLPGLSTPLLLVRDPIAFWVVYKVWNQGRLPKSLYISVLLWITFIGFITALIFGHGSPLVALYGARIMFIHFPFVFAMGVILKRNDVVQMGKALLWISLPMVVLIGLQFYTPQTSWVNKGIGGEGSSGFSGAMGYFRPSATFSFTNGTALFFGLVCGFVIYFWLNPKAVNKLLLMAASAALIMAIPLSISRTYLFTIGVTVIFAAIGASRNPKYAGKMLMASVILVFAVMLLSQVSFVATAIEVLTGRFDNAAASEGGLEGTLGERYLGAFTGPFLHATEVPFFGYGLGLGTSVGSQLLTGNISYLISEGEWGRIIGELGLILGSGIIFIRMGFALKLFVAGYKRLVAGDLLPWMLLAFGLLIIPQGQWAQPTSLGFCTIIGGLIFASLNKDTTPIIPQNHEKMVRGSLVKPVVV